MSGLRQRDSAVWRGQDPGCSGCPSHSAFGPYAHRPRFGPTDGSGPDRGFHRRLAGERGWHSGKIREQGVTGKGPGTRRVPGPFYWLKGIDNGKSGRNCETGYPPAGSRRGAGAFPLFCVLFWGTKWGNRSRRRHGTGHIPAAHHTGAHAG